MAMLVKEIVDCYLDKLRRDELTGGVEQFNCLLFVLQLPSICSRLEFPLYRDGELVLENVELYKNVPPLDIEKAEKEREKANKVGGEQEKEVEELEKKVKVKKRGKCKGNKGAKRNKNNSTYIRSQFPTTKHCICIGSKNIAPLQVM